MSDGEKTALHLNPARDVLRWENGTRQIDLDQQFRDINKDLLSKNKYSKFSYNPDLPHKAHMYHKVYEAKEAHGYPGTAWLQLGLLYACGLYTAKEQGLVRKGVIFTKFWRFHYFDYITFIRRGVVFAWAGGLLAGTIMFGSPDLSLKRAINRFNFYVMGMDVDYDNKEGRFITRKF